ncbi:MAG: hypothetical protein WA902_03295 [Thermosynechococcaceae cyanobacterium]
MDWLWHFPNHNLDHRPIVANFLRTGEEQSLHVLHCSNTADDLRRSLIYATVEHGKVLNTSGKTAIHYRVSGQEE